MSYRFPILLACAFLGYAAPVRADLLVKDKQKVAFLGDSITQYGWSNPGGYVKLVVSGLQTLGVNVVPVPAGISSQTSKDMLARLDASVLSQHPNWMTLSCGVNDVWHGVNGVDLEDYKKNITAIVDQAQAQGVKVMIFTATMIGETLDSDTNKKLVPYNDFLRQLAKERNLPLVDLNASFQTAIQGVSQQERGTYFTIDGVHMNPYGNRIMAEGILRGFGATDAQIASVKAAWDQQPGGVVLFPQWNISGTFPMTFPDYDQYCRTARASRLDPTRLQLDLLMRACREVRKAHAQDASSPTPNQLQPEIDQEFKKQVQDFLVHPPPPPPPTPPQALIPRGPFQTFEFTGANGTTLPYLLLIPEHLEPGKKYPLVLFFHGAGECGTDNDAQLRNGIQVFAKSTNQAAYPAFIIAPQCPAWHQWVDMPWGAPSGIRPPTPSAAMTLALGILDKVCAEQPIDPDRIYVAGLSMGGYAAWDCITRFPDKFAAGVAVCGGGDEHTVTAAVAKVPLWAFHSADDPTVPVGRSRGMIAAMQAAGGSPHYTEYYSYRHYSWVPAFNEPELLPWLFAQVRGKPDTFPWQAPLDLGKKPPEPTQPVPAPAAKP